MTEARASRPEGARSGDAVACPCGLAALGPRHSGCRGQHSSASLGPLDLSRLAATAPPSPSIATASLLRAFTTRRRPLAPAGLGRDVDPRFLAMLLAFEDRRFETHHGVDWRLSAARRAIRDERATSYRAARRSPCRSRVCWSRATRARCRPNCAQMVRALRARAALHKKEILDLYLALAPYGGNLEGLRAASLAYFGKEPKRLSVGRGALLVALPQSPEARRPDPCRKRPRARATGFSSAPSRRGVITKAEASARQGRAVPPQRRAFPAFAPHATEAAHASCARQRIQRFTYDARCKSRLKQLAQEACERLGPRSPARSSSSTITNGDVLAHVGSADYFSPSAPAPST